LKLPVYNNRSKDLSQQDMKDYASQRGKVNGPKVYMVLSFVFSFRTLLYLLFVVHPPSFVSLSLSLSLLSCCDFRLCLFFLISCVKYPPPRKLVFAAVGGGVLKVVPVVLFLTLLFPLCCLFVGARYWLYNIIEQGYA
jgi:hypothetical protein